MHAGVRIGRYEILSVLGRGGMGEVFRARDTKLKREVAIKSLPEDLARDPQRLARLESEAQLLAALNHPNIATIHGIEEHDGSSFLVLELVDGVTLADRLRAGALPIAQALEIGAQIAAGLEAAHDKNVVHRDLKPANVNVTADGRVKVLDFGLAMTIPAERHERMTRTMHDAPSGIVSGTAPYMSPELARGEEGDAQTDVWSFGVVLYEMLTGDSPFERDTTTETLARVLEAQPDYTRLPASVRHLVRRCLEKDRRRRFRDIGDVKIELEEGLAALATGPFTVGESRSPRRAAIAAAGFALAMLAALGLWSVTPREDSAAAPQVVRFALPPTREGFLGGFGVERVAVSADGSRVAHAAGESLLIRRLSEQRIITIESAAPDPFFSPDGEWVGFLSNGVLKVPSGGGTPVSIAAFTERPAGATWSENGTIVFATTAGIFRVPANGGEPELLAKPDPARGELQYAWPRFLPGDRSVLFTIVPRGPIENAKIARLELATSAIDVVLTGGTSPRYLPTGHLLYAAGRQLMAVRFDPETLATSGEPRAVPGVDVATDEGNGAADFSVSSTGTLVFVEPRTLAPSGARTLSWIDRTGREEPIDLEPGDYIYARISPDGTRIAIDRNLSNRDVWVWDIGREAMTRLTDGPTEDMTPLWSPDSRRVFFSSDRTGNFDIYSQLADGSAQPAAVFVSPASFEAPNSISPDGSKLITTTDFRDLAIIDVREGTAQPLLVRDAQDWLGVVSPDGRWFAYESDESGTQFEIYVRPFPDANGRREKVSVDGGRYALFGGSNELFYIGLDGAMMAVPIELGPELRVGRPVKLFDFERPPRGISGRIYDVSQVDGRFLVVKPWSSTSGEAETMQVVLNWFEELRAQVP